MRWGSLDTFLVEEEFWQERMGKPAVNLAFLEALLRHGTCDAYHFFCRDENELSRFRRCLDRLVPSEQAGRIRVMLQGMFSELVKRQPPDVMHQGDFTYYMPFLIELRNRWQGDPAFPVTGVTHSLDGVWIHGRLIQLLLGGPEPYDAIVCTSRCALEMLRASFDHIREAFRDRFKVALPGPPELVQIPLGLAEEAFSIQDRALCRRRLGIDEGEVLLLSVARFSPRHKMDLAPLLECVEWLKASGSFPRFRLILAGAGKPPDLSLVRQMIDRLNLEDVVDLEANVSFDRKMTLYGAADIFVSLADNFQETFGLSILEAMAQGLPVVASDFNGYRELVDHGRTGFLIPTYLSPSLEPWETLMGILDPSVHRLYQAQKVAVDLGELRRALEILAANDRMRREMGIRAASRLLSHQWSRIIPQYEAMWREKRKAADAARRQNRSRSRQTALLTPSTIQSFGHYPTRRLSDETRIRLSDYGKARQKQGFWPILYEDVAAYLHDPCRIGLLEVSGGGLRTIGELRRAASDRCDMPEPIVQLHIDWLVKHGFLDIEPGP